MIVKLLTEHHLECLSLEGCCRGSSELTHVKLLEILCTGSYVNDAHLFSLCMTLNVKNETATRIPIMANVDMVTYIHNGTATTLCITYVESRGIWPSVCDIKMKTTPSGVQCFSGPQQNIAGARQHKQAGQCNTHCSSHERCAV